MPKFDFLSVSKRFAEATTGLRQQLNEPLAEIAGQRLRGWAKRSAGWGLVRVRDISVEPAASRAVAVSAHPLAEHIAQWVQKRLSQLEQTRYFTGAKDPVDALHDFRVASRRLRAFVDLFKPMLEPSLHKRAHGPLKKTTRAVRALRDWDVQIELLNQRLRQAQYDTDKIVIEDLLANVAKRRDREALRANKRMRGLDFQETNFALCATLGATLGQLQNGTNVGGPFFLQLIEPFALGVVEHIHIAAESKRSEDLHELRIQFKKLRYALEVFEPLFGGTFQALYEPVEAMQQLLGKHQDLVVLDGLVQEARQESERTHRATMAKGLAVFQTQLNAERGLVVEEALSHRFDPVQWLELLRSELRAKPQSN